MIRTTYKNKSKMYWMWIINYYTVILQVKNLRRKKRKIMFSNISCLVTFIHICTFISRIQYPKWKKDTHRGFKWIIFKEVSVFFYMRWSGNFFVCNLSKILHNRCNNSLVEILLFLYLLSGNSPSIQLIFTIFPVRADSWQAVAIFITARISFDLTDGSALPCTTSMKWSNSLW